MGGGEQRLRSYHVGENEVFDLFTHLKRPQFLTLPRVEDLPPDARVVAVHHEWKLRAFYFVVEHESFDPVPEGTPVRNFGPLKYERVTLVADDDRALVRHLEAENLTLRGVFSDVREDGPAAKAAYEMGLEDAARVAAAGGEGGRLSPDVGLEIAVRHGTNAAVAAQIRSLKGA